MQHLFYPFEPLETLEIDAASKKSCCSKGSFTVLNHKGLHTRPSTELVKCANQFKSNVHLTYHKISINAKSVLDVLALSAQRGALISIEAEGEDAEEAIEAIIALARNKFNIHY